MNNTEAKQLLLGILDQAREGKSFKFQFITSWDEFMYYRQLVKSTGIVIKTLQVSADNLFKEYCKDVIAGISDVNKLLAYSQLQDTISFYENDVATLKQMLDDYDEYLGKGNFLYSLLGGEREV